MESFRDSPLGQIIRLLTNDKYLQYPEEKPGFVLPLVEHEAYGSPTDEELSGRRSEQATARHDASLDLEKQQSKDSGSPHSRKASHDRGSDEPCQSEPIAKQMTVDGHIIVDWYGPRDPENPQNWNLSKKVSVTLVLQAYTLVVYASSAIYTPSTTYVTEEFNVSAIKASLGLSMFVLGYGKSLTTIVIFE